MVYEVTTYRAEVYVSDSRKPTAVWHRFERRPERRDFTIAMAAALPSGEVVDLFGGVEDLREAFAYPRSPQESFSEDPLRMMRALVSRLAFNACPEVLRRCARWPAASRSFCGACAMSW